MSRNYTNNHPDQDFVYYLCDSLLNGFDSMISDLPKHSLECSNLLSAVQFEKLGFFWISQRSSQLAKWNYYVLLFITGGIQGWYLEHTSYDRSFHEMHICISYGAVPTVKSYLSSQLPALQSRLYVILRVRWFKSCANYQE